MAKCAVCGKGPQFGHNVSHSKARTNRRWLPNIQKTVVMMNGRLTKMTLCTACMRKLAKQS
jgi:large subunit ribosomal protein L28